MEAVGTGSRRKSDAIRSRAFWGTDEVRNRCLCHAHARNSARPHRRPPPHTPISIFLARPTHPTKTAMSDMRPPAPQSTVIPTPVPNSEAHAAFQVPDPHPPKPSPVMPEFVSASIAPSANAEPTAVSAATSAAEPQTDAFPSSHPSENPATPPTSRVISTNVPSPTINIATRPSVAPQRVASPEHDLHHQSSSRDQLYPLPTVSALALARDRDALPPPLPKPTSRPSTGGSHVTLPAPYPAQPQVQSPTSQNPTPQRRRSYSPQQDMYGGVALQGADGLGRNTSGINFVQPRAPRPVMVSSGGGSASVGHGVAPSGYLSRTGSQVARGAASEGGHGHGNGGGMAGNEMDWIVPKARRELTVGERLQPTIDSAVKERDRAAFRAKMSGFALNIAIGLQVLLGALTTGLGAALTGKSTSVAISILGGASTIVASYLARARGSNEPEASLLRVQALEHFLREASAFKLDHGHEVGTGWDRELDGFRGAFEGMMGHPGRGIGEDDARGGMRPRATSRTLTDSSVPNEKMGLPVHV